MPDRNRLSALCAQTALTGIDFIRIVDPAVQTVLHVFFVVDPTALDTPIVDAAAVAGGPVDAEPAIVSIVSVSGGESVAEPEIIGARWRVVAAPAGDRTVLEVETAAPGDFSLYRLTIDDARIDRFFNGVTFSFKQGCPSDLDCEVEPFCPPEDLVDFPIDYLARDFTSYGNALRDFAAQRYPEHALEIEADAGVMLREIMAGLGDEFAYIQDRYAREAYLDTATQRRSLSALARLVDYYPDPGRAATTDLAIGVATGMGGHVAPAGAAVWATPSGERPIAFELTEDRWVHEAWNAIPLHTPDSASPCLEIGATEAFLATASPLDVELEPVELGEDPVPREQAWIGRTAILRSRPEDPSVPSRAWRVVITEVKFLTDPLTEGGPVPVTRIAWGMDEALPFQLCQAETEALLNVAPVIAGEKKMKKEEREHFRIGPDAAFVTRYGGTLDSSALSKLLALPRAVEREGPCQDGTGHRPVVLRYGLRDSEQLDLGWTAPDRPDIELIEVLPGSYEDDPTGLDWTFTRDPLSADDEEAIFTLDEGVWRDVVVHQTPHGDVRFSDYAADSGFSVRFGAGAYGRTPSDGTIFEVVYRTGPALRANLAPDSVTVLARPGSAPPDQPLDFAAWATNPLLIDSGIAPEAASTIRIAAPEAFRALPFRAVRPEDYREIVERLDWVQRANAVTMWTGSWPTDLVAADERGSFALSPAHAAELEATVDCIRQAGRAPQIEAPQFLSLDVEVTICVAPNAYPGDVKERVIATLVGRRLPGRPLAFFDPDNFTFGQPLVRSTLEAAVQAVPGTRGVERIRVRVRHFRGWRDFDELELAVAPSQILRCANDPNFPERGSLSVVAEGRA